MPPNFYHQVSFSRLFFFRRNFFLARLFVFGTISFRHDKSRARKKKVGPKKSRADNKIRAREN